MTKRRLYIVDDEAVVRASIVSLVQAHGDFECDEFPSAADFLAALDRLRPGCVILDLQLQQSNGLTVMKALSGQADFRMIVVSGCSDQAAAIDAFRAGAIDFFYKPYEMRPLLDAMDRAYQLIEQGVDRADLVDDARARIARLGPVETEILAGLGRGQTSIWPSRWGWTSAPYRSTAPAPLPRWTRHHFSPRSAPQRWRAGLRAFPYRR